MCLDRKIPRLCSRRLVQPPHSRALLQEKRECRKTTPLSHHMCDKNSLVKHPGCPMLQNDRSAQMHKREEHSTYRPAGVQRTQAHPLHDSNRGRVHSRHQTHTQQQTPETQTPLRTVGNRSGRLFMPRSAARARYAPPAAARQSPDLWGTTTSFVTACTPPPVPVSEHPLLYRMDTTPQQMGGHSTQHNPPTGWEGLQSTHTRDAGVGVCWHSSTPSVTPTLPACMASAGGSAEGASVGTTFKPARAQNEGVCCCTACIKGARPPTQQAQQSRAAAANNVRMLL